MINSTEQAALVRTFQSATNMWIGLHDLNAEGTFEWADGSSSTYRPWSSGNPDNWGNEDCVEWYPGGAWNDRSCGAQLPFMCETCGNNTCAQVLLGSLAMIAS